MKIVQVKRERERRGEETGKKKKKTTVGEGRESEVSSAEEM